MICYTSNYPFMTGGSIWLFSHLEHQNQSITDAMDYCCRIRKKCYREKKTDGEKTKQRETNY